MNRLNSSVLPILIVATLVLISTLIVWQTKASMSRDDVANVETIAPPNTNTSTRPFEMYIFTPGQTITVPTLGMAVSLEESSMQCPDLGADTNANEAPTNTDGKKPCENPQYYARFKTIRLQQNTPPTPAQGQPPQGQQATTPPAPQQDSVVFTTVPGQQIVNNHQVQLVELTQESARIMVFTATVAK